MEGSPGSPWELLMAFLAEVSRAGNAIQGFGMWLVMIGLVLESTPLNLLTRSLLPFLAGIFVARLLPELYLAVCFGLLVVETRSCLAPVITGFWNASAQYPPLGALAAQVSDRSQQWIATLQRHPCVTGFMQLDHSSSITGPRTWLFLAWLPLVLPWTLIFRLESSAAVMLALHVGFLLNFPLHSANSEQRADLLRLVQHVGVELRRMKMRVFGIVGATVAMMWVLPLYLIIPLEALAVGGLAAALCLDERLRENYINKLSELGQILPSEELVDQTLQQVFMPFVIMTVNFNCLVTSLRKLPMKRRRTLLGWAMAGAGTELALSLLTWLLYLCAAGLQWVPRVILVAVALTSYSLRDDTELRSTALLCGITASLTLEMTVTGCACACRIGSVSNTLMIPLKILTHVVGLWLAGMSMIAIQQLYSWNLRLRKLIFKAWLMAGEPTTLTITVPEGGHTMLDLALQQVGNDSSSRNFDVSFDGPSSFTTDRIDMNGLTKHFCTLVGKAVRLAPDADSDRAWPFMRLWDKDAARPTYHLNYEARFFQFLKHDEYTPERVEEDYRNLGSLVAMFFMKGLPFLRLSKALIKFLLREQRPEAEVDEHELAISLEDLEEMRPSLSKQMMDQHLDGAEDLFNTCSLEEDILDKGTIQIATDAPNPWKRSRQNCKQVAEKLLENDYVLPVMEAFRDGFRTRLQMDILGKHFTAEEVQAMLAGSDTVNVVDWRARTNYPNGNSNHPVVKMFWRTLMRCTQEQLQVLLMEVTGQPTPPAGGFQELLPPFALAVHEHDAAHESLRHGKLAFHTCFNSVDILATTTEEELSSFLSHLLSGKQD